MSLDEARNQFNGAQQIVLNAQHQIRNDRLKEARHELERAVRHAQTGVGLLEAVLARLVVPGDDRPHQEVLQADPGRSRTPKVVQGEPVNP